jgi:hypothetical protein
MMPPRFYRYRGYCPHSKTLVGPTLTTGDCFGSSVPAGRVLEWIDTDVLPMSGDIVSLVAEDDGELLHFGKQLERTRDGRWWGVCEQGALPLDFLNLVGIAVVVAHVVFPEGWQSRAPAETSEVLTPENRREMLRMSRPALHEWVAHGFGPPAPFPSNRSS